jgi:DNA repair protein RadC
MEQKQPDYVGHRERMHEKVQKFGLETLLDYEVLEYLLYFSFSRKDTKPLAKELIHTFGSLAAVMDASEEELCKVKGVGSKTARLLHLIPQYCRYYMCDRTKTSKCLKTSEQIGEYLLGQFHALKRERMMMLALNDHRQLLKAVWLDAGSVNAVNVDMHKLATEAVLSGASVVILAHNHPGGVAIPSREDILATGNIMRALGMLGIHVLDHFVVTDDAYFSMRDEKRLPFYNSRTGELTYVG